MTLPVIPQHCNPKSQWQCPSPGGTLLGSCTGSSPATRVGWGVAPWSPETSGSPQGQLTEWSKSGTWPRENSNSHSQVTCRLFVAWLCHQGKCTKSDVPYLAFDIVILIIIVAIKHFQHIASQSHQQPMKRKETSNVIMDGYIYQQTPLNWWRSEIGRPFWSHHPDGSMLPPHFHYIIPLLKGLYSEVSLNLFALVPRASFFPASSIR